MRIIPPEGGTPCEGCLCRRACPPNRKTKPTDNSVVLPCRSRQKRRIQQCRPFPISLLQWLESFVPLTDRRARRRGGVAGTGLALSTLLGAGWMQGGEPAKGLRMQIDFEKMLVHAN